MRNEIYFCNLSALKAQEDAMASLKSVLDREKLIHVQIACISALL